MTCHPPLSRPARSRRLALVAIVLAGFCSWSYPGHALGQEALDKQFTESFDSMGNLPWYDAEAGEVEAIPVAPRIDDSVNRNSRWLPKPAKPPAANQTSTAANPPANQSNWRSLLTSLFGNYADVAGWTLLLLLFGALAGVLVWIFLRMDNEATSGRGGAADLGAKELDEADLVRLENLPIDVRSPRGNLLAEADRLRASGKLDEAIVYLFGHRLIQLDRGHAIRLARGKTNRQYLRELRGRDELYALTRETVELFEESYFGRHPVGDERFDAVRAQQARFEELIHGMREAA